MNTIKLSIGMVRAMLFFLPVLYSLTFNSKEANAQSVQQYKLLEMDLDFTSLSSNDLALVNSKNPFDKNEIAVKVSITGPNGNKKEVYGFYYEDYTIKYNWNKSHENWKHLPYEYLTKKNISKWKLRYTPTATGWHNYQVKIELKQENKSFNVKTDNFYCFSGSADDGIVTLPIMDLPIPTGKDIHQLDLVNPS